MEEQNLSTDFHLDKERLQLAIEGSGDGLWDWNIDTGEVYLSPQWLAMLGYSVGELAGHVSTWKQLTHPEDLPWVMERLNAHLNDSSCPYQFEYRLRTKSGDWKWIGNYGKVVARDSQGNPLRMAGLHKDISKRKQAEERLKANQKKFEALVTNMPGVVYRYFPQTADCPHYFTFVSQQANELLELAPEAIIQDADTFINLIHAEDLPSFLSSVAYAVEHFLPWQWEGRIITPSGQLKWIQGNSQAQNTAEGDAWDGLLVDVSERKFAEQKIREQATLIDIATDAIFVRNIDNRITFWNQGAEQLYGWTSDEAVGQLAHELFQSEPHQELELALKTAIEQGSWQGELTQTTKTGQKILVASRWTLLQNGGPQPQSLLVVNTDITEKRQLEAQFYQAQRLESIGLLASGLAHDLNNILTPILGIARLLPMTQTNLNEQAIQQLNLLENSAKRGATLVQQILSTVRGGDEEQSAVILEPLLQEVTNILQQSFPASIEIRNNAPASDNSTQALGTVFVNPTQLHQVLMNLCVNARDAMPNGGILTISAENIVVDETLAHRTLNAKVGNYVVITIADTGSGIAPEIRDRIFDPFFTTKGHGKGSGLGLATVLGIVKNYNGFLQVDSEVGHGTHIKVYLPILKALPTEQSSIQSEHLLEGSGELILVVDDEVIVQQTTQALLETQNYATLLASSGVEAISLYQQHQDEIRLVITDVMMPSMTGIELIQKLKSIDPLVKVIAISGLPAYREEVLEAGAHVFLSKPYPIEKLLHKIFDLISQRQISKGIASQQESFKSG